MSNRFGRLLTKFSILEIAAMTSLSRFSILRALSIQLIFCFIQLTAKHRIGYGIVTYKVDLTAEYCLKRVLKREEVVGILFKFNIFFIKTNGQVHIALIIKTRGQYRAERI